MFYKKTITGLLLVSTMKLSQFKASAVPNKKICLHFRTIKLSQLFIYLLFSIMKLLLFKSKRVPFQIRKSMIQLFFNSTLFKWLEVLKKCTWNIYFYYINEILFRLRNKGTHWKQIISFFRCFLMFSFFLLFLVVQSLKCLFKMYH